MNINSIHSYDGVKNNNRAQQSNNKTAPHPLAVRDELAFQSGIRPSLFKQWISKIKNTDYMEILGKAKQAIEVAGFFALFLIQDFLGMTFPRTWTGFNRDREITGKFHIQEGLEVAGREGLTGPAMMAIPAVGFGIAGLAMGKSTFTNSRLIRSLGKTLTQVYEGGAKLTRDEARAGYFESCIKRVFKDTVGTDAREAIVNKLKNEFQALSKVKILEGEIISAQVKGTPKEIFAKDFEQFFGKEYNLDGIRGILKDFSVSAEQKLNDKQVSTVLKNAKKELQTRITNNISSSINNALLETQNGDLSKLNKVIFDGNTYNSKELTEAIVKYSEDAITMNKNFDKLNAETAEEFKNSMLGKRCVANLATGAAVLGIMNYLPKLYAFGKTAPGETSKQAMQNQEHKDVKGNVAFTGLFSSIGKKVGRLSNTTLAEGEFNGINFSNTLMSGISIVGLTIPRAKRAYERAPEKTPEQRQNEGWFSKLFKKDASEIKEIAVRDPISALSVVFAVPLLTRAMVKSYENSSGFVLINHQADEGKGIKKVLKYLNPYNSIAVLGNAELDALYGKVNTHEKLVNVCEYLSKKGGDLEKIFAKSDFKGEVFNNATFTLKSIRNEAKEVKNSRILELIKNADDAMKTKMVDSLLPAMKKNKALGIAKTLNALPFFLNLLVISPILLGMAIPKYTYKLTRQATDKANGIPKPQGPAQPPIRDKQEIKKAVA